MNENRSKDNYTLPKILNTIALQKRAIHKCILWDNRSVPAFNIDFQRNIRSVPVAQLRGRISQHVQLKTIQKYDAKYDNDLKISTFICV